MSTWIRSSDGNWKFLSLASMRHGKLLEQRRQQQTLHMQDKTFYAAPNVSANCELLHTSTFTHLCKQQVTNHEQRETWNMSVHWLPIHSRNKYSSIALSKFHYTGSQRWCRRLHVHGIQPDTGWNLTDRSALARVYTPTATKHSNMLISPRSLDSTDGERYPPPKILLSVTRWVINVKVYERVMYWGAHN